MTQDRKNLGFNGGKIRDFREEQIGIRVFMGNLEQKKK